LHPAAHRRRDGLQDPPDYSASLPEGDRRCCRVGPPRRSGFSRQWEQRDEILPALENSITWTRREHAKEFFPIAGIEHDRALASLERFKELLLSSYGPRTSRPRS